MSVNPTIDLREGEAFDLDAVDRVLKQSIDGLSGTPVLKQYASGASNLTYALDYPERRLVLRRPPFGTKPKSGHDMYREYRVMTALKPAFPAVPDTLYYVNTPDSVLGAEFYVMERSEGHLIHKDIPKEWNWDEDKTRTLCHNFFDKLIELHQVDYKAIGLEDFGRPEGYVARQIHGWNKRYEKAYTPDVDAFEDVRDWLAANIPAKENSGAILHGDFRIDNLILDLDDPTKIVAILDWEISALGDPLMDLGNTLAYWIMPTDPAPIQMLSRQPSGAPGMLTRKEILAYYAEKTGADVNNFHFYYVYGIFRLAVIMQQIYYRYYHGQTKDDRFKTYGLMVNILGGVARDRIADGEI
ncbi:MAG: phosphotransferase family protein [Robiginitomaculum sp.]|nr:MAG: phosphotransferase family protein [Robiginitomaculum sp.]